MSGRLESRCVDRVYGKDVAVRLGAENHMLQLNV